MSVPGRYGIHWFRRDLRVAGNPALQWSWKEHRGRVVGVFCFDREFLARPDFSSARFQFFLKTLEALREELREIGGDLLVLDVGPDEAFARLWEQLRHSPLGPPATVSFNRDYEPFAVARDSRMTRWFEGPGGVLVHSDRDHVLLEPNEVLKTDGSDAPYVVYSPYRKRWLERFARSEVRDRVQAQKAGIRYLDQKTAGKQAERLFHLGWNDLLPGGLGGDLLAEYLERNGANVGVPIPQAGSRVALAKLREFSSVLRAYAERRDFPAVPGTSRLSIYLKNGSLTVAQIIAELGLEAEPNSKYLHELIWREFYYAILALFPEVEHQAFQPRYRSLRWRDSRSGEGESENLGHWKSPWEADWKAWKEGRTGFPIVDAGMRQLNATGWMHNRVRMIVASFLTKDLGIDYRLGERYFMEKLLDGDLAPNNGGWQWAASTGVDAQPYFRVFNPTLQAKRFDPDGDYIRRWVPELAGVPTDRVHEPVRPIVDHAEASRRAIAFFAEASAAAGAGAPGGSGGPGLAPGAPKKGRSRGGAE
jgi:deoxyribodipyrimidine photo-lyase